LPHGQFKVNTPITSSDVVVVDDDDDVLTQSQRRDFGSLQLLGRGDPDSRVVPSPFNVRKRTRVFPEPVWLVKKWV